MACLDLDDHEALGGFGGGTWPLELEGEFDCHSIECATAVNVVKKEKERKKENQERE